MLSISRTLTVSAAVAAALTIGVHAAVGAVLRPTAGDSMVAAVSSQALRAPSPVAASEPVAAPDDATEVIRLTNDERAAAGLAPLTLDATMMQVARSHSLDQAAAGRMSHVGSDGSTIAARLTRAGVAWGACAENVALGQSTAADVVGAWMGSPGHRANMLGRYGRIGVGVAEDGAGRRFWTMVLAD